MRFSLPVSLDVVGRRCVVVGGGPLSDSRAAVLALAGAEVDTVPSGGYRAELLDGAFLAVLTGEDDTDPAAFFADAEARGVLANALDDVAHCHFAFPSLVQRGAVRVAVSTGGHAPALARRLRQHLEGVLPEALGTLVEILAEARAAALPREVPFDEWAGRWSAALEDLDGLLALCAEGRDDEARQRIAVALRGGGAASTSNRPTPAGWASPTQDAATIAADS